MGLLHTSSIELSRYRALVRECPDVLDLNKKSVAYLDFDGVDLGLSNRFLKSPKVLIQSKYKAAFEAQRNAFYGKKNLTLKAGDMFDDKIFNDEKYDCIIWWSGPKDDHEFKMLQEMKKHAKELIIFGFRKGALSDALVSKLVVTEFRGLCLSFIRVDANDLSVKPTPKAKPVTKSKKAAAKPIKKAEPAKTSVKTLSGKAVTVGEMKTEQETMIPTNIKSSSSKTQPLAKPKIKPQPKTKTKAKPKPKPKQKSDDRDVEVLIENSSEQAKMEMAFMISGELPESVESAESVIRSASKEDLELVF